MLIVPDHRRSKGPGSKNPASDLSLVEEIIQLNDDFWDDGLLTASLELVRKLAAIGKLNCAEALLNRASKVFPRFSEASNRIVDEGFDLVTLLSKAGQHDTIDKVMERAWDLSCPGSCRRSFVATKILTLVDTVLSSSSPDVGVRWLVRVQLSFPVGSQERRNAFRCRLRVAYLEWQSGDIEKAIQLFDATADIASYSNSERLILLRGHLQLAQHCTDANRFEDAVLLLSRAYLLSKPGSRLKRRVVNEGLKLIPKLIEKNEFHAIHLFYQRARVCMANDAVELRRVFEDYVRVVTIIEQSGQIVTADWMLSLALKDYPRDSVEYEQIRCEKARVRRFNEPPDAVVKRLQQRTQEKRRVIDKIKTFLDSR